MKHDKIDIIFEIIFIEYDYNDNCLLYKITDSIGFGDLQIFNLVTIDVRYIFLLYLLMLTYSYIWERDIVYLTLFFLTQLWPTTTKWTKEYQKKRASYWNLPPIRIWAIVWCDNEHTHRDNCLSICHRSHNDISIQL